MSESSENDSSRGRVRRVLVIAYYFPPMSLSGVQRVAKLVKYLPEFGWLPTVLTVKPAGYFAFDPDMLAEVEAAGIEIHRTVSLDPTRLFGKGPTSVSLPAEDTRRWFSHLSQFFFIPDNKIGWFFPAVLSGLQLLSEQRFDAIFSSAPPYTAHLIAAALSKVSGAPLITDFRDDWVGNPRHIYPTPVHRAIHQFLERLVLSQSETAITINEYIASALRGRSRSAHQKNPFKVVPQGYDAHDFAVVPMDYEREVMHLVYCGIFYDAQTPDYFLRGLALLVHQRPEVAAKIKAVFVGMIPETSLELADTLGISHLIRCEGYLAHKEAVAHLVAGDVLWMTVGEQVGAEGISTGKLYEYFGARKPILALVPPGTVRATANRYGAARIVSPTDVSGIAGAIGAFFDQWRNGGLPTPHGDFVAEFERKRLAGEVATLLARVTNNRTS